MLFNATRTNTEDLAAENANLENMVCETSFNESACKYVYGYGWYSHRSLIGLLVFEVDPHVVRVGVTQVVQCFVAVVSHEITAALSAAPRTHLAVVFMQCHLATTSTTHRRISPNPSTMFLYFIYSDLKFRKKNLWKKWVPRNFLCAVAARLANASEKPVQSRILGRSPWRHFAHDAGGGHLRRALDAI